MYTYYNFNFILENLRSNYALNLTNNIESLAHRKDI